MVAEPVLTGEAIAAGTPEVRPGAGTALPPQEAALRTRLDQEYVSGGASTAYASLIRSLPQAIDDLTADWGEDLYQRMVLDPQVAAAVNVLKAGVLETGPRFTPVISDEDDPDFDRAQFLADWVDRIVQDLRTPLADVLWNMADALFVGNKVAELVYAVSADYGDPGDGPQLVLQAVKVKPYRSVSFLVDAYLNVIGILGRIPGQLAPVLPGTIYTDLASIPNLIDRRKFAVFTFRPKDSDPRGTSILRPIYYAWWVKQQLWGDYLKYLSQFASPAIHGTPSPQSQPQAVRNPDGTQQTDGLGNPLVVSPEQAMLADLLAFRNGTALVTPPGSTVNVIPPASNGQSFLSAFEALDLQISKGILHVTLATEEGRHQARAAAEVHADVLSLIIRQAKQAMERMLHQDILKPLVTMNYGPDAARLTPIVNLGDVDSPDLAKIWTALAALMQSGYFSPDQLPQIDAIANLPVRLSNQPETDPGADAADVAAEAAQEDATEQAPPSRPPPRKGH